MDIAYCQLHLWLNWDLIHVLFHFPKNTDRYTQSFCDELGAGIIV